MTYVARRSPRHESRKVRGLTHRLTWWGEPSDTPLVLLHGFLDTGETWQFVVDHLPDSWSCVAPDWRGFGDSDWSSGGYWFPDYYADLEALLDELVPNAPARVVGHSMGGNIAMTYAGIRPRRLEWAVSLEGLGLPRTSLDQAPQHFEQWLDQLKAPPRQRVYDSPESLVKVLLARNPRLAADRAQFIAAAWSRKHGDGPRMELAADPAHRLVNPTLYRRDEAEACWRRAEIPILMVLGEHSEFPRLLGADCSDTYFRSVFRHIEALTIPGVGHMMHHEDPETVARRIVEFARAQALS